MLTRNASPFLVGTKVTSVEPPNPFMTIIVRGEFRLTPNRPLDLVAELEQGFMQAETFEQDDEDRTGACVYPGDFADFKPSGEVLLRGSCRLAQAVPHCTVKVAVGNWGKSIRVVGDRRWNSLGSVTEPTPFTTMPLGFDRAFGGPEFSANPVGRGQGDWVPNLEHPRDGSPRRGGVIRPVSFGPINPEWPSRRHKRGKEYGGAYARTRAPFYSIDFDWRYFLAGSEDQAISGYFRGDERFALHHLHPEAPVWRGTLPGRRVRAFVKDDDERFREVPMKLDTVFFDLEEERLFLTWRGLDRVKEPDLDDVAYLFVADEALDEAKPVDHYRAELEAFAADPVGLQAELAAAVAELDEMEIPDPEPSSRMMPAEAKEQVESALGQLDAEQLSPEQRQQIEDALDPKVPPAPPPIRGKEVIDSIKAALLGQAPEDDGSDDPPVPVVYKPGVLPSTGLRRQMRPVADQLEQAKTSLDDLPDLSSIPEQHRPNLEAEAVKMRAEIDKFAQIVHDPCWKELDPTYEPPGPLSTDPPGPWANLVERDLSHQDLRGADLRGANLDHAVLIRTNLEGANLEGASFRHAVLFRTRVSGASLRSVDLTHANCARLVAEETDLSGAKLNYTFFEDAILKGAIFDDVIGDYPSFERADMSGLRAHRASFPSPYFQAAKLDGSDWSDAIIASALFESSSAVGIRLCRANIEGSGLRDADLRRANLTEAKADQAMFLSTNLEGADLTDASLRHAHLTKADLRDAILIGTDLCEARLYRACLDRAKIEEANLFRAELNRANVEGTSFERSNLYEARLIGARGRGVSFRNAELTGVISDVQ